jgi:hypothetical protein
MHGRGHDRLSLWKVIALVVVAVLLAVAPVAAVHYVAEQRRADPTSTLRPPIHVEMGKVRPPLQYRIVSFHRGKADKRLIRLASQLGFNGVQIQIEGSTVQGIKDFAAMDAKEHLVDYCHQLGMAVTVWVHEISDVPPSYMPDYLGPVTVDNDVLWAKLDDRYEWILGKAIPNIDGLCLTVVETDVRATNTPVLLKLCGLLRSKCDKYGKQLQVRTFVWYPDEFADVMAAIAQLPKDTVIMSKVVPQDWQMRGTDPAELGAVGGRPQIEEYDVCGEYWMRDRVANCMTDLLKRQFDYGMSKGISGICVRVDREDVNVLQEPSEVNLWTLGMFADGATDNLEDVWNAWGTNRFNAAAAPGVEKALRPTGDVIAEMFSIGDFTFGETRRFPQLGDEDVFGQLQQNWWWDKHYSAEHVQAETGDPAFIARVGKDKQRAIKLAQQCIDNLKEIKDQLTPEDYAILMTKLWTNQMQLAYRAPMAMAVLHYRRMVYAGYGWERNLMDAALQEDLNQVRQAADPIYPYPTWIFYLGKWWDVGVPSDVPRDWIFQWAGQMDQLSKGNDPRPGGHRTWNYLDINKTPPVFETTP